MKHAPEFGVRVGAKVDWRRCAARYYRNVVRFNVTSLLGRVRWRTSSAMAAGSSVPRAIAWVMADSMTSTG